MNPSAALRIGFPAHATAADRDRLVGLLADRGLLAIHEDDPAQPSAWTAHFESATARDAAAETIRAAGELPGVHVEPVEIPDEDWARRTQADLPAVRIGQLIVAPPWDLPAAEADHPLVIVIEPSRGFGTGHHQSTRLALLLLQTRDLRGRTMIDVGTGSGVLAIAGAARGAANVSAIDVDPDAIENARENAARNAVADRVDIHVGDLDATTLLPADVVTANLTGALLERHAAALARLVKRGGLLIASGFTEDERERVIEALAPLQVSEQAEEDGWWALALTRE